MAATVAYLEDHAAFSRAGKAGVFQLDSDGLVIAAHVHRTSRTLDPQLLTHLLISAKVRRSAGAWRALDGRDLFAQQKAASAIYQSALRAELAARLGVEWESPVPMATPMWSGCRRTCASTSPPAATRSRPGAGPGWPPPRRGWAGI